MAPGLWLCDPSRLPRGPSLPGSARPLTPSAVFRPPSAPDRRILPQNYTSRLAQALSQGIRESPGILQKMPWPHTWPGVWASSRLPKVLTSQTSFRTPPQNTWLGSFSPLDLVCSLTLNSMTCAFVKFTNNVGRSLFHHTIRNHDNTVHSTAPTRRNQTIS